MDFVGNLAIGAATAFSLHNLLYCAAGALLGTMIGVLPGLGPLATIAMLLPLTFSLPADSSLIMLAGIYYGAQYGGSTTAILINVPGESSSVVTALDGHALAKQGQAGTALAAAAIGSFIAGTLSVFLVALAAPPLAGLALKFGPAEYFSLMVFGLVASVTLASGSLLNGFAMIVMGMLLGTTGLDLYSAMPRITFGTPLLYEGFEFVVLAMAIFGIGEVMRNLASTEPRSLIEASFRTGWLSFGFLRQIQMPVLRGTVIGSILGILPGGGAMISSFASYAVEKRMAKEPEQFGKGAIAGVAGPESANNAGAQTSFIPMLTLGIPSNPVMALMIGAIMIQGITPGPNVMTSQPALFWGLIVSMWIGNLILLLLNLPLVGLWARLVSVPYEILFPVIVATCILGAYSISNSTFDVYMLALFGVVGYFLWKLECSPAPLLLGFVLGPMLEEHLRRALLISEGNPLIFVERPISAVMLVISLAFLAAILLPGFMKMRQKAFVEE